MGVGVTITIAEKIALQCPEINSSSTILYLNYLWVCSNTLFHNRDAVSSQVDCYII